LDKSTICIPEDVRANFLEVQFLVRAIQELLVVRDVEQIESDEHFLGRIGPPFERRETLPHPQPLDHGGTCQYVSMLTCQHGSSYYEYKEGSFSYLGQNQVARGPDQAQAAQRHGQQATGHVGHDACNTASQL
jgi:hypothetical protein